MKARLYMLCTVITLLSACGRSVDPGRVVTNPIDLDYAFYMTPTRETIMDVVPEALLNQLPEEQREPALQRVIAALSGPERSGAREAADPVVEIYKGRYYLFASMSKGYWSSDDMQHWKYIAIGRQLPTQLYAPTAMVYQDELYWMTSDINCLYKSSNPEDPNSWQLVTDHLNPYPDHPEMTVHDPDLFLDEDGRVYLYWGCSDVDDIMGIELDPARGFRSIGTPVTLIMHREAEYGWEQPGDRNEIAKPGYNEGPSIFKYGTKYFLQYAGPGTEYDSYGDGLYTGDSPLGPFSHADYSPVCIKPGGWMTGAGHGDTFRDKNGNWWHVASTVISQRMDFERRIGFFPMVMTQKGHLYAMTQWSDHPYSLPDGKWTGWMDLSIHKNVSVSSKYDGHMPEMAADNTIKTWWSAETGAAGEWISIDLGKVCRVNAIQTNFADQDFGFFERPSTKKPYRYVVETSKDGKSWKMALDKSSNRTLNPHELLVLDRPVKARFVRITNKGELSGKFSVYDVRVFGQAPGNKPAVVRELTVEREEDARRMQFSWAASKDAQGYILHWGTDPEELYSTCQTEKPELELGLFSAGQKYYFKVDAINESGVTLGKTIFQTN